MLFFETWEVSDPAKCDEHDELCREWIIEYAHAYLGEEAVPHKLYNRADSPQSRALSVEVENKEQMDKVMEKLFSDEKFMEYFKKWEEYVDDPPIRVFWDEQYSEEQNKHYKKAKKSK